MEEVKKKKKAYVKPELHVEEFTPNEYIVGCYNYTAMFHCYDGEKTQNGHGAPCSNTYVEANGVNISGHEDTEEKAHVKILNPSLTSEALEKAEIGKRYEPVTWTTFDDVHTYAYFNHTGWWEIKTAVTQDPKRPNHS